MSVIVLIVNWNSGVLLSKCLEHLMVQTVKPLHVLVLDNASTDASVDIINSFENVTLDRSDANLGFAADNNRL